MAISIDLILFIDFVVDNFELIPCAQIYNEFDY